MKARARTSCILLVLLVVSPSCAIIREGREFRANPNIVMPDLQAIGDGTYVGEYSVKPVYAQVEVTVADHTIARCDLLKHESSWIGRRAEGIVATVVEEQSVEVDAVSGATHSSYVILRAAQNALEQGLGGS